jgi:hypothetical protein
MIVSILGADIRNDKGIWHTNDIKMSDGDLTQEIVSFRVVAAAYIQKANPSAIFFVQGGWGGWQNPSRPSIASVMKRELEEFGVPEEKILVDEKSQKTFSQLRILQDFVSHRPADAVTILSNVWHLQRIAALLAHVRELDILRTYQPTLIGAEDVLLAADLAKWHEKVALAQNHPAMQEIIAAEACGVKQIQDGTYKFE